MDNLPEFQELQKIQNVLYKVTKYTKLFNKCFFSFVSEWRQTTEI